MTYCIGVLVVSWLFCVVIQCFIVDKFVLNDFFIIYYAATKDILKRKTMFADFIAEHEK